MFLGFPKSKKNHLFFWRPHKMTSGLKPNPSSRLVLQHFFPTRNLSKCVLQLKCFVLYFLRPYPAKGFETSVSEDEEKLDIVRVVCEAVTC